MFSVHVIGLEIECCVVRTNVPRIYTSQTLVNDHALIHPELASELNQECPKTISSNFKDLSLVSLSQDQKNSLEVRDL